jgi:phage gp29-like protein
MRLLDNLKVALRGNPRVESPHAIQAAAPLNVQRSTPADTLLRIINPSARDRWQSATISQYTPQSIQNTLRGALVGGDLVAVWDLFNLMEETWPELLTALIELKDDVAAADLTVQPWALKGEEPNAEAQRRAKLFEQSLWTMRPRPQSDENDLRGTIKDLLDAWGKGISVLEIDWGIATRPSPPGPSPNGRGGGEGARSLIAPVDTRWIHPRCYGYPADSAELKLNASELQQRKSLAPSSLDSRSERSGLPREAGDRGANLLRGQWIEFPPDKFLIGIAKTKSGHPIGGALLRAIAWWWAASNFSTEWLLNFAQIFGLPIRWATYDPARPGLLADICDMLENMGASGWGAFPAGTTLELKEASKGASGTLPQESILDRANRQVRMLILGQTLTGDEGASGSRALGEVHERILGGRKRSAADWVCAILSYQLAPAFCRLNFGDESECPWVQPAESSPAEKPLEMAQRDEILSRIGFEFDAQAAYERHKLPRPAPGADVIMRPAAPSPRPPLPLGEGPGGEGASLAVHAKDATDQLTENVLENLTSVQARWLAGVKPFFRDLIARADTMTDEEWRTEGEAVLVKARRELPELFDKLDADALAEAMEEAMGAAVVNGAVKGALQRRVNRKS